MIRHPWRLIRFFGPTWVVTVIIIVAVLVLDHGSW